MFVQAVFIPLLSMPLQLSLCPNDKCRCALSNAIAIEMDSYKENSEHYVDMD